MSGPGQDDAALLAAYLDGELDQDAVAVLGRRLAAEPDLAADLAALARVEHGCRRVLRAPQTDTAVIALRRRLAAPRRTWWPWAAAASVLLALGALWLAWPSQLDRFVATTATVVEAAPGVRAELEAGADLRVIARADPARGTRLELAAGAAWFEVAPSPLPVLVATTHLEAEVLGTRFQVERLPGGSRVAVERGLVAVRGVDGAQRSVAAGESFRSGLVRSFAWTPGASGVRVATGTAGPGGVLGEIGRSDGYDRCVVRLAAPAGGSLFACDALPVLAVEVEADPGMNHLQAVLVLVEEDRVTWRGNCIAKVPVAPGGGVQQLRFTDWPLAVPAVPPQVRPAYGATIILEHFGATQRFRLRGVAVAPR